MLMSDTCVIMMMTERLTARPTLMIMRGKRMKNRWNDPGNRCRWYLEFSARGGTSISLLLNIATLISQSADEGELSHHFCWVGSHFKVSIGHMSEESFCCQSSTFQNIWALPNEWIVPSVFLFPFRLSRFFHSPTPQRKAECYSKRFEWWER